MRIIYAATDRVGANYQLLRFLDHVKEHDVAIATFTKSGAMLKNVNWILDTLYVNKVAKKQISTLQNLFNEKNVPTCNITIAEQLLADVDRFAPDLIISDGEPIFATIARSLNVKLWYCSPIHLYDGIDWGYGQLRYSAKLEAIKKKLHRSIRPDRIFVYSPFGDIKFRPQLKNGYEWITPYHTKEGISQSQFDALCIVKNDSRFSIITNIVNYLDRPIGIASNYNEQLQNSTNYKILSKEFANALNGTNTIITEGCTSDVADAIYNNKKIICIPELTDTENILNSILVKEYNIGSDLGQLEYMERFSIDYLNEAIDMQYKNDYLDIQTNRYLHEELCKE